jgi:hypothetical protein
LLERTVGSKIVETYPKLKVALTANGCKVVSEALPNQILFIQGSLWGISPKTAKKIITANLEQVVEGTRVKLSSKLASDWKNITLIGCAFAIFLAGLCIWMATDLTTIMITNQNSFWSWLVAVEGIVDLIAARAFVNLMWGLVAFLSLIIILEALIVVYVRSKIDAFTEEILNQLS